MIKRLSLIIIAIAAALTMSARGSWKLHPSLWTDVTRVVETPAYVYFSNPVSEKGDAVSTLFRYDKESGEAYPLSPDNLLSSMTVEAFSYSPVLKTLLVADSSHDIHILHDNGTAETIHGLRYSDTDLDRTVNSISSDSESGQIILATGFGIVSLDPRHLEVAASKIYGVPVASAAKNGDDLFIVIDNRLLHSRSQKFPDSPDGFETIGVFDNPRKLTPAGEGSILFSSGAGIHRISMKSGKPEVTFIGNSSAGNIEQTADGVSLFLPGKLMMISGEGETASFNLPQGVTAASSLKGRDLWYADKTLSLNSIPANGNDGAIHGIRPNAPSTFTAASMKWHPAHGIILCNPGHDPNFTETEIQSKLRIATFSDGLWTDLSPIHLNPENEEPLANPNGFDIDPDNPDLFYFSSILNGMERVDVSGAAPAIHLSRHSDPYRNLPGFGEIVADLSGKESPQADIGKSWAISCPFAAPAFDSSGNLWTAFADYDDQDVRGIHLFCWEAENRRNAEPGRIVLPRRVKVAGPRPSTKEIVVPLKARVNRNLLLYTQRAWNGEIVIIDTAGTPADNSDDTTFILSSFTDQDGNPFDVYEIRCVWEDQSSGEVWIGHRQGVFKLKPTKLNATQPNVERIKVSRNDGTNLADYLLDEVPVNFITSDSYGRKWFATSGAGIVATSSDGKSILESHTSANSPLPADVVYSVAFDPEASALLAATSSGIAEYRPAPIPEDKAGSDVKVYPNPVRPDFSGYVTIEGLPDGAIVKIADASGAVVKELSPASGGTSLWDVTDRGFKRVGSGVYHVLCQGGSPDSAFTAIGKIMVIN